MLISVFTDCLEVIITLKPFLLVVFSGEYLSIIVYKNVTINAHKYMEEPGGKQLDSNFLVSFLVCRLKLLLNTSIF